MINKIKRYIHRIQINRKQNKVNRLYANEGLTDEVLRKQVEINTERNQYDIPDDDEKIYMDFVQ